MRKQLFHIFFIICGMIIYGHEVGAQELPLKITMDDLWTNHTFHSKSVRGLRSMQDGTDYTTLEKEKYIIKYSYSTGEVVDTIVDISALQNTDLLACQGYEFNRDETKLLLVTQRESIYRHSFTANYYVVDLKEMSATPLSVNGKQRLAEFSPDGKNIAFVRDNNIFIVDIQAGTEQQITFDGEFNKIINGAPDWVYEEEFGFNKAFCWSQSGNKLAYIKFDESNVKEFSMTMFAGDRPKLTQNDPYPSNYSWKYPKAGEANSVVSVHVFHLQEEETVTVDVGVETDQYIPRIRWTYDDNLLSVFRMNRRQDVFELLIADSQNGSSSVIYKEKNEQFISQEVLDFLTFLPDNKHFILLSEMDGWNHLYLMDMKGNIVRKITEGDYDVTDFIGYDSKNRIVYFQAAKESPLQREVYAYSLKKKKMQKISHASGITNLFFSKGFRYYIESHSSVEAFPSVILYNNKGKKIRVLEDNEKLMDTLSYYRYSTKEFFSFMTSDSISLNGYMIKPLDFDSTKTYPLLMTQYSGPNSQQVKDEWGLNWYHYLAQEGYVVACVDGRGTGARGEAFRKCTYLQLGKLEAVDQIEAAKFLGNLSFIDKDNIAIWGWSYGGFMTCLTMTKGEGVFKAGIAIAPVTNWRYYDNIYTERYMRTPQENKSGYEENSPLNFADGLQGNLLIVHGTADDNVHVQNTMEFTERLVQAGKSFDMFIYTNRNHGIYGGATRKHLYQMTTDFLNKHLKKQ